MMSVFIFLLGGAYFLYKYVEEEKGKGPKGGYIAVAIAAAVLVLLTLSYQADPNLSFLEMDSILSFILKWPLILVLLGVGIPGLLMTLDSPEDLRQLPQFMVVLYLILVVFVAIIAGFCHLLGVLG